tara:strand:- start:16040 stop:16765 length:726 start_codon:yes stop_codon:yes gene_type:complete
MSWGSHLGFNNEKVLLLHADDAGSDPYINTAIFESLKQGIIQSCSVLVRGYPDKFLFKIRDYDHDVGLHFNARDSSSFGIDAQHKYMAKKGVVPSHIDSHGGSIFFDPRITKVYREYAKYKNIPCFVPEIKISTLRRFRKLGLHLNGFRGYKGIRVDYFYILSMLGGESFEEKKRNFLMLLDGLRPGITKIILHISSNLDHRKWYWEWELFEDPDVLDKLSSFTFTNWKEMWSRYEQSSIL